MPLAFADSATVGAPLHFCAHLSPERPHLQKDRPSSALLPRWRGRDRPQEGLPGSLESMAILERPKKTQTCFLHGSGQPLPDLPNDAMRKPRPRVSQQPAGSRQGLKPRPEQCPLSVPGKEGRPGRSRGPLSRDSSCPGLSSTPSRERPLAAGGAAPGPHPPQVSAAWPRGGRREEREEAVQPQRPLGIQNSRKGTAGRDPGETVNPPRVPTPAPGLTKPTGPGSPLQRLLKSPCVLGMSSTGLSQTRAGLGYAGRVPGTTPTLWCWRKAQGDLGAPYAVDVQQMHIRTSLVGQWSACQCRGHRFDPWSGN